MANAACISLDEHFICRMGRMKPLSGQQRNVGILVAITFHFVGDRVHFLADVESSRPS
jgi:hypothetical protein